MKPKLLLLTGPAAGEVGQVFREMSLKPVDIESMGGEFVKVTPTGEPAAWDEVRDFGKPLVSLAAAVARSNHDGFWPRDWGHPLRDAICSLPGGEAWLVGLVLPECPELPDQRIPRFNWHMCKGGMACVLCRERNGLPARLAIIAPDPPALLVERVKAWGGSVWVCQHHSPDGTNPCHITIVMPGKNGMGGGGRDYWEGTWPEAVRAALGEA